MKKKEFFASHLDEILQEIKKNDYLTQEKLFELLKELKEKSLVSKSLAFSHFLLKLIDEGLIQFSINIRGHLKVRYTMNKEFDVYKFCNSLEKNSYFLMTTSLNLQNLSTYKNDFIFISKERKIRNSFDRVTLNQENIDKAFSKKPRQTNAHDKLGDFRIIMLETNNTSSYEIINFKGFKISSINRAFVEIISNIHYFQTSSKVVELFKPIKNKLNLEVIYKVIEKFDFVYPYYQLAGFYLEKIGYEKKCLERFYLKKTDLKFYTEKNKDKYVFDEYWNIYYSDCKS